ncbi:hypothetical protein MKX03_014026 [Papaver bracteatum]|nr:hypothetical protein MKX03_014026 [Papaver bracteatum]
MKTLTSVRFFCGMGNSKYYIYKHLIHIGMDMWDAALEKREEKLLQKLYAEKVISIYFFSIN